jgi:carbamoyl-phosphate synthase large subunit
VKIPHYGVKEAVLPFYFYPEVDPVLGPEMRSTGEVLGMSDSYGVAFYKAQDAAKACLPLKGKVLMTVADKDKQAAVDVARRFTELGLSIVATSGTRNFLKENGIEAALVNKMHEPRPHVVDCIKNGDVQLVINTPLGKSSKEDDSSIRKAAIGCRVPYVTTTAAALSAVQGIAASIEKPPEVKSLQDYHSDIGQA